MMHYTVIHTIWYNYDDPDMAFDPVRETLSVGDEIVLSGDWYHDKISEQIKSYLLALDHHGIPYTKYVKKCIKKDEYSE